MHFKVAADETVKDEAASICNTLEKELKGLTTTVEVVEMLPFGLVLDGLWKGGPRAYQTLLEIVAREINKFGIPSRRVRVSIQPNAEAEAER